LIRIIRRAGLEPWPKLFHNLRATRQPELEESFSSHVVCAWIGNSEKVARKHYLQVTVGQFAKAVHNPVHYTSTQAHAAPHAGGTESKDNSDIRGDVALCGATCSETMGDEGLEHLGDYPRETKPSTESDAKSDALSADSPILTDADLGRLVAVWPRLPEDLKAQILKLAEPLFLARRRRQ
jgi:hypothetical protein